MLSSKVEAFIAQNPQAVIAYNSDNHQGYRNPNPACTGITFERDLYLVSRGHDQARPQYFCVESESRNTLDHSPNRFLAIDNLRVALPEQDSEEARGARTILAALTQRDTALVSGFEVDMMRLEKAHGIFIGRKRSLAEVITALSHTQR